MNITKYPFLKWQWIVSLLRGYFISSIADNIFRGLDNEYHGHCTCYNKKTGTVYHSPGLSFGGVRVANLFSSYDKIINTFLFNAHDLSMKDNSISFVNKKGSTII